MRPTRDDEWAERARKCLHWYSATHAAWLSRETEADWHGWATDGAADFNVPAAAWRPWSAVANDSEAPFVRWYIDALTSAAFNELDRHILQVRMHAHAELISLILFLRMRPFNWPLLLTLHCFCDDHRSTATRSH